MPLSADGSCSLLCLLGKIYLLEDTALNNFHNEQADFDAQPEASSSHPLSKTDIYTELHLRGYNYGPTFQGLLECSSSGASLLKMMKGLVIMPADLCMIC